MFDLLVLAMLYMSMKKEKWEQRNNKENVF